jgi:hypothetical protein
MDKMSAPDGHLGGGDAAVPMEPIRTSAIRIGAESCTGRETDDRTGKELSEGADGLAAFAAGGG